MANKRKVKMVSTAIINKNTGAVLMRSCSRGEYLLRLVQELCDEFNVRESDLEFKQNVLTTTHQGG